MDYTMDKQGIEVEFQQVDKKNTTSKYLDGIEMSRLCEIHRNYHPDDGKVEVSTDAFENLGDLADQLKNIVGSGLKVMNEWFYPITMGCTPFYPDFASAHVHNSVKGMNEDTWIALRQRLFSAQPLIDLLSQNSPLVQSVRASDVRMLLSNWSTFTDLDSQEQSHWFAIAYGLRGQTIEVRIPSSAPLFQTIGMAALLRVILEDDAVPVTAPITKENWQRVINYGSSSICDIAVPKQLRYDGWKHGKLTVRTTDLWKAFLEGYREQFDKILGQLPKAIKVDVNNFYEFIAEGHSLSDSYFEIINKYNSEGKEKELAAKLAEISYRSYTGGSAFEILPRNPKPFMPIVEKYYSISEVTEMSSKLAESNFIGNMQVISNDVLDLFLNIGESPVNNGNVQNIMNCLYEGRTIRASDVSSFYIRILTKSKVIAVERGIITKGDNFALAISLCKEAGIL